MSSRRDEEREDCHPGTGEGKRDAGRVEERVCSGKDTH